MKRTKYFVLIVLSFILYGNTLLNEYALDDSLVITENEYTLSGFNGIDDHFKEEFFSGFFDEKDKKLVAGGRYRPLSMVTFAIEWQLVMGTPFKGINQVSLEKRMNQNANHKFILPSQKLLKDLSKTIHIENRNNRVAQQNSILNKSKSLHDNEKQVILSNLKKMHSKRNILLFISHFINILLYALTVIVLYNLLEIILVKYSSDKWYLNLPFLISLLFLAHPIHTEVVANIKGRDELMSLLGALLTALLIVMYIKNSKSHLLVLSFVTFLFALFSKEVAVTFLAIIPLSTYFFIEKEKKGKLIFISIIPLVIASLIYFYARGNVLGGMSFEPSRELMNNSFLGMTLSQRFATVFYTLLLYVKLLIFPHPLTYDYYPYHVPIMNWTDIWPIIAIIIYLGIGIYAIIGLKKKKIFSYGILFYLIALSPMSNIFFPIGVFMNERFVYAASIGFIIILAYMITNKLPNWVKGKNVIVAACMVIMVLYSIKTISRNRVWKNDFTLFTNDVKISQNSAKSNTSAGGILIEEAIKPKNKNVRVEYLDQAIFYLKRAIKIHPKYSDAYLLLGNAQWERYHSIDSTFKYYNEILKRSPKFDLVYSNIFETGMKTVFDRSEQADDNVEILYQLEKYNPGNFHINYYLGRIYGRYKNNLEISIHYLEKAASINPNSLAVYKDLGVAYGIFKNYEKSAEALYKAIELDQQDPVLKLNLAMTLINLGKRNKALTVLDSAYIMNFNKENADILINLGYLYRNLGNAEKARECFLKAQALNPELFNK